MTQNRHNVDCYSHDDDSNHHLERSCPCVERPIHNKTEFTAEMETRYERMLAGHETMHDLIDA